MKCDCNLDCLNRGFALMLKFFELEGRFPRREDVPKAAVDYVAGR